MKELFTSNNELYAYLQTESGIVNSAQYAAIADMHITDQQVARFAHSIHRLSEQRGEEIAFKKVLDILRVNPLLALRIANSCTLCKFKQELYVSFKMMMEAAANRDEKVVLNKTVPYTVLLIEAAYQDVWEEDASFAEVLLQYVKSVDAKLHEFKKQPLFLTPYTIRHIFNHVPAHRQIELINWFWQQHCYAARSYKKTETYSSRRVDIMLQEMQDTCLWKHVENMDTAPLSERERARAERERQHIRYFIDSVMDERVHLPYIKTILGEDSFREKLVALMGESILLRYDDIVRNMPKYERELDERRTAALAASQYSRLTQAVSQKYLRLYTKQDAPLCWYTGAKRLKEHLGLWTMWQGMDFTRVKIMVLGSEWGCTREQSPDMAALMASIFRIRRGDKQARYPVCESRPIDKSLAFLFKKAFARDIQAERYTDLFFSHLCLGYRKKADAVTDDGTVLQDVDAFLERQIKTVAPAVIFCLGERVHRLFWKGMQPESTYPFVPGKMRLLEKQGVSARVYAMPDCSGEGTQDLPLDRQLDVWSAVRKDMEQNGICL